MAGVKFVSCRGRRWPNVRTAIPLVGVPGSVLSMRGGNSDGSGAELDVQLSRVAARAAKGDGDALEELIDLLNRSRTVHRMVGKMLLDQDSVDDVAQEVFLSITGSISQYRGAGKVSTWLHPIVKRRVVDHLRKQRETIPIDEPAVPSLRFSSMVASRAAIRDAVAQLPEKYRTPLILRDLEELPVAEVAARLGRPEGTVKAQISRGREKLEKILGDIG